jgi:hypothetical protein
LSSPLDDGPKHFSPSVNAAGPRLQTDRRFDSYSAPFRTAGICSKPARAASFSGRNFLPHHEPMMMSGGATISSAVAIRSFADLPAERSTKMSIPPAISISSERPAA